MRRVTALQVSWLGLAAAVRLFILATRTLKLHRQNRSEQTSGLILLNAAVLCVTLVFLGLLKYNITGSLF